MGGRSKTELLCFQIASVVMLTARLLMLIFYARQTTRHLMESGKQVDTSTVITFRFLGFSIGVFVLYGAMKSALTIISLEIDHIPQWQLDHQVLIDVTFGILRHLGYLLNNLAFTFNIARWGRILGECEAVLRRSSVVSSQRSIFRGLAVVVTLMTSVAIAFVSFQASGVHTTTLEIYFYSYQGLFIHPCIIIGYILTYKRLRNYHSDVRLSEDLD